MNSRILSDESRQHGREPGHHRIQVEHLRLQDLLAAEGQELAGEGRRAVRRRPDQVDVAAKRMLCRELRQGEVAPPKNDGEEVVEIVRDPTGQLADGLHLLGLNQVRLRLLQVPVRGP